MEKIRKLFSDLNSYLEVNNALSIISDPTLIFNGDKTGFSMLPKSGFFIAKKGCKNEAKN